MAATTNADWKYSLHDVWCIDPGLSVEASFCTPCVFGRNAEALGYNCSLYGAGLYVPFLDLYLRAKIRGEIRERRGIPGDTLKDYLDVWCCGPRALVQETIEVRSMNMQRS